MIGLVLVWRYCSYNLKLAGITGIFRQTSFAGSLSQAWPVTGISEGPALVDRLGWGTECGT